LTVCLTTGAAKCKEKCGKVNGEHGAPDYNADQGAPPPAGSQGRSHGKGAKRITILAENVPYTPIQMWDSELGKSSTVGASIKVPEAPKNGA